MHLARSEMHARRIFFSRGRGKIAIAVAFHRLKKEPLGSLDDVNATDSLATNCSPLLEKTFRERHLAFRQGPSRVNYLVYVLSTRRECKNNSKKKKKNERLEMSDWMYPAMYDDFVRSKVISIKCTWLLDQLTYAFTR